VLELRVAVDAGDVMVTAGSGSAVAVALTSRLGFGALELTGEQDGSVLVLEGDCPAVSGWWLFGGCPTDYEITAPPGTSVVLESGAGSLSAMGMRADASLHSSAGDVEVADHEGNLTLQTSAGEIMANDVAADRIQARSQRAA